MSEHEPINTDEFDEALTASIVDESSTMGSDTEEPTPTEDKPKVAVGSVFKRWRETIYARRLDDLNLGISLYPENATNYVLRGELFLESGQTFLAKADFETALALASTQVLTDRWGIVAQSVQDRAIMGLRRVNHSE